MPIKIYLSYLFFALFLFNSPILFAQNTVYFENFNSGFNGWTAISVLDANNVWSVNNTYAEINGIGTGADEDWLISPVLNLNNQDGEYLIFEYNDSAAGNKLELFYSLNYNGGGTLTDLQSANWINMPLKLLDINSISCFQNLFQFHPAIDISGIAANNVYFAFKYTGTGTVAKRYRIDNFRIEANYYNRIDSLIQNGLNCAALKSELYALTRNANVIEYTSSNYDIWDALLVTDRKLNDAGNTEIVWDMFTDWPFALGEPEFNHCTDRDNGSCSGPEGTCYNREHTFPRSWWGNTLSYPSDSINFDLHHLVPSDKGMNNLKSNYPPGIVLSQTGSGSNGFKVGTNSNYPCTAIRYFEPIDEYKGDYARMFLYIATRYEATMLSWFGSNAEGDCALTGNTYPGYAPWMMGVLLRWHASDPVSQKEIDRNNAVYAIQGNRNPFIDNPQWVGFIWGDTLGNSCAQLSNCFLNSSQTILNVTNCGSYTLNGQSYTSAGTYTQTLSNAAGCDSVITLNLSINSPTASSLNETACGSYTLNGQTYTIGGTYTQTLSNAAGCDSVITLNLSINSPTSSVLNETACESYTLNGQSYTSAGTYTQTLSNAAGCDSVITLNLSINSPTSSVLNETACGSYTLNGQTYTSAGTYTQTLSNAAGCDSVITLNLIVNEYPDSSIQQSGLTLSANISGAVYQWLNCDNAFSQITGENGQSFTASSSGNYAVQITENGCSSISECVNLTVSGNQWNRNPFIRYRLYPNPARGQAILELLDNLFPVNIKVMNCLGQIIGVEYCGDSNLIEHTLYLSELPAGTYFIQIHAADQIFTERLVVTNDN